MLKEEDMLMKELKEKVGQLLADRNSCSRTVVVICQSPKPKEENGQRLLTMAKGCREKN